MINCKIQVSGSAAFSGNYFAAAALLPNNHLVKRGRKYPQYASLHEPKPLSNSPRQYSAGSTSHCSILLILRIDQMDNVRLFDCNPR